MSPMVFTRRCGAVAALAASFTLLLAASASATPAVWGATEPYGGPSAASPVLLLSISCASVGNCAAAGLEEEASGAMRPIVAAESAGTWGPASTVTLPPGASTSAGATSLLKSVSCVSTSTCVATGYYKTTEGGTEAITVPFAVSGADAIPGAASVLALPAGAASGSTQKAALEGVSCTSAGSCTAVGSYLSESGETVPILATPGAGGQWSATAVRSGPPASERTLSAISCPSTGACEAVGSYTETKDRYPWAVEVRDGKAGAGRALPLPPNFKPSEGTPNAPYSPFIGSGVDAISCPSAGVCTAAGAYKMRLGAPPSEATLSAGVAIPITNGAPGTPTELGSDASAFDATTIAGIWCSDANDCTVAGTAIGLLELFGTEPIAGSEIEGSWSRLTPIATALGTVLALTTSLTCTSAERCLAGGAELALNLTASPPTETITTFLAHSAPALSLATSSLPAGSVGAPYSATLQAAGGTGSQMWSVAPGSLPPGLSLNAATGVISGTPTASGQDGFIANAADAGPPAQTASAGLSITVGPAPQPAPVPAPAPVPTVEAAYLHTSGTKLSVVLDCAGAPCTGTLRVAHFVETPRHNGKTHGARTRLRRRRMGRARTITLARGRYSIAAGHTMLLTLRLTKAARRLLARLHRISGHLYATPTGASRPAIVESVSFTSHSKSKRHGKGHRGQTGRRRHGRHGGRHTR